MIDYQIKFWEHLAIDSISNDDAYIFATGLQSSMINLVILKKQSKDNIESVIDEASTFFAKHNVPWGVNIIEDKNSQNIINYLTDRDFKKVCTQYEMDTKINSLNVNITSNPKIIEVINSAELQDWVIPIANAFDAAAQDAELYFLLNKKSYESDSNILKHFVLYDNNAPISSATLSFFNETARLDNVATLKAKQGLGFGKEIIQYCINKSLDSNCNRMIFESSEEGISLYRKLGFSETGKSYIYSLSE